jgi:glycosyltransferase involved in cell wall biosynthesis
LCSELPLKLLVVGQDDRAPFLEMTERLGLARRVRFEGPSPDVMQFYAAADVYASPSLHDSFALPVAEAMACGLPAVTSSEAGVSAFVEDGADCFVLRNPRDAAALARILRRLYEDADFRHRVGEKAADTAKQFSWGKNAASTLEVLEGAARKKMMRSTREMH